MDKLTELLRPKTLDELLGQTKIKPIIDAQIKSKKFNSMILYGPPATGKTSIGNIIANESGLDIILMNANFLTKKEITESFKNAPIILFVDEIHRLNKINQELFLEAIENQDVILIGATTESPFHELTPALRSRCIILKTEQLNETDLYTLLDRCETIQTEFKLSDEAKKYLIQLKDPRVILNTVSLTHNAYPNEKIITENIISAMHTNKHLMGDKDKNFHYMMKAAYQKSIRGSNADAALYYLSQMLKADDIEAVIRRMRIICYEDIGLANPYVWSAVEAACQSALAVGLPEASIPLANATALLALSEKNNAAYKAYGELSNLPQKEAPDHIASEHPPTYKYPHNYPNHWCYQEYMPEGLENNWVLEHCDLPQNFNKTYTALKEETLKNRK